MVEEKEPTWGYKDGKAKLFESDEARKAAKYSDSPKEPEPEPEPEE